MKLLLLSVALSLASHNFVKALNLPQVVAIFENTDLPLAAWNDLQYNNGTAVTSLVAAVEIFELNREIPFVGYGWSIDENGFSSLDATIFDGATLKSGSVGNLKLIRRAIRAAYYVLQYSFHSILVGNEATEFAVQLGLVRESLSSVESITDYENWRANSCQQNYWRNVVPDPTTSCGPYWKASDEPSRPGPNPFIFSPDTAQVTPQPLSNYPTVLATASDSAGLVVIDQLGNVAAGSSTAGRNHRTPGRISDVAVPGATAYASNDIGGAVTTGSGDVMVRFSPAGLAVSYLEAGLSATESAQKVIDKINRWYPNVEAGVVVVGINGDIGAACSGRVDLTYSVVSGQPCNSVRVETVQCSSYCGN